jgi:outer membrane beta-barrel protein
MDRRLHVLLLTGLALAVDAGGPASAQEAAAKAPENPQVVEPRVERRDVNPAAIDTENFETGAFAGTLSIEDFGASFVYGARLAYHFTEDLFAEATIGTAKAGRTSYEDLSGSVDLLTDDERQFSYYDLSLGWNVLPGEAFLGGTRAMPSALYLTLGAGSTRFGGDDFFTVALGAGYRLLLNDWLAVHADARDLIFKSDLLGTDKTTQNLQFTLGLTAFF